MRTHRRTAAKAAGSIVAATALAQLALGSAIVAVTPDVAEAAAIQRDHIYLDGRSELYVTLYSEPNCPSSANKKTLFPGQSTDTHGYDCVNVPGVEPFYVTVYHDDGDFIIQRYYAAGTDWRVNFWNANDYVIYVP